MADEYDRDSEDFAASVRVHHAAWERGRVLREAFKEEREERERQEREQAERDRETDRLYQRLWYAANYPRFAAKKRERALAYHRAHREQRLAAMRAYRKAKRSKSISR